MLATAARWEQDDTADQALSKLADLMPGRPDAQSLAERSGQLLGITDSTAGLAEAFWAVAELVGEMARWAPVVLVVDDLHWAERSLLDLLDHLAAVVVGRVLLLGAARPEIDDSHPGWAESGWSGLGLSPLTRADAAGLLDGLLSPGGPPAAVREHVLAVAEGNPLYVEQLVGMLVDEGTLCLEDDAWVLSRDLIPGELPGTISSLLAARLDRLPLAARREIEAGSVVGRVFWRGAVAELAREAVGPDAGRHLVDLVRRQLILPEPGNLIGDEAFKFQHVLIRDAVYGAMPKTDRAMAHRRFADWLETAAGDRAVEYEEVVGYHLEQAVRLRSEVGLLEEADGELALRAGRRLAAAGGRAHDRGDVATTTGLLTRAERLLRHDKAAHVDVTMELGRSAWSAGRLEETKTWFTAALDEASAMGDERRRLGARLALLDMAAWVDDYDPAATEAAVLGIIPALQDMGDDAGLAEAWFLLGRDRFDAGRAREAEEFLERAILHARRSGRRKAGSHPVIWLLLTLRSGPTPASAALARLESLPGEVWEDMDVESQLLSTSAFLAALVGDFDRAWRLAGAARRLFSDLGIAMGEVACAQLDFEIALRVGDLRSVEGTLRAADHLLADMGEWAARSTVLAMLAHVHAGLGRLDEAKDAAELARKLTQPGDLYSDVLWRTALARVLDQRGDPAAEALAQEAVGLAAASDWLCLHGGALLHLAEIRRRVGKADEASAAAAAALALFEEKGDLASGHHARAMLEELSAAMPG
jgi:tetratricopeptide (TPR) repeat protein